MSIENPPLDTQSVIEIVSDDIVPPVIGSSVIDRTKEQYAAMNPDQKRDFRLAVLSTVGGVALTAAAFAVEKYSPSSRIPTILRGIGYTLDYADGYFAKRTATHDDNGAGTEFGAIADPLADKFNNTLNEIALVQNGQLRSSDLAIRALRDTGVTAARKFVTQQSSGKVDVKANKFGKLNTVVRDGVNLFASTQIASRHPRVNRMLQTGANIYSLTSGAYTTHQLIRAYRKSSI
jgi:phosphatidylglycerophosphate synthase